MEKEKKFGWRAVLCTGIGGALLLGMDWRIWIGAILLVLPLAVWIQESQNEIREIKKALTH